MFKRKVCFKGKKKRPFISVVFLILNFSYFAILNEAHHTGIIIYSFKIKKKVRLTMESSILLFPQNFRLLLSLTYKVFKLALSRSWGQETIRSQKLLERILSIPEEMGRKTKPNQQKKNVFDWPEYILVI